MPNEKKLFFVLFSLLEKLGWDLSLVAFSINGTTFMI